MPPFRAASKGTAVPCPYNTFHGDGLERPIPAFIW